jgi:hypothetical protein
MRGLLYLASRVGQPAACTIQVDPTLGGEPPILLPYLPAFLTVALCIGPCPVTTVPKCPVAIIASLVINTKPASAILNQSLLPSVMFVNNVVAVAKLCL